MQTSDSSSVHYPVGTYVWVKQEGYPWWPGVVVDLASMEEKIGNPLPMPEHLGVNGLCVMCFPTASSTLVFVNKVNASELLPFAGGGHGKGSQPPQDSSEVMDPEEARRIEDGIAHPECEPAVREALALVWKMTYGNTEETAPHPVPAGGDADGHRTKGVSNPAKMEEEEEDLLLLRLDPSAMASEDSHHREMKKRKRMESGGDSPPKHRSKHTREETKKKEKKMKREMKREKKRKERERKEEGRRRRDTKKEVEEEEEEESTDSEYKQEVASCTTDSSENDSVAESVDTPSSPTHRSRKAVLSAPSSSVAVSATFSPAFAPSARHVASDAELLKYSRGIRSSILFFTQEHPQTHPSNVSVETPTSVSSTTLLFSSVIQTPSQSPIRENVPSTPSLCFPSPPESEPIKEIQNIEEEEKKEEDNLLYHLRALAQCNVTMEQLQQLGIGRVVGFLLQLFFPARVQVLAKAILDYWFSSLESATKEVLLDTADVMNCSVESIIGEDEEEEDRGLGDAIFREISGFQATIYSILVMGFEEELERFTNAEPTALVPPSIRQSFPVSPSDTTTDPKCVSTSTADGKENEHLGVDEKSVPVDEGEKVFSHTKDLRITTEESAMPFVEESRLRAVCEAMETSLLRCQDVDIRVAVLHRLEEEKKLRNALLEGAITAEEVVEKEEEIALGVSSPLYNSTLMVSPLFSPSSGEGSPTSAGATTLYQCPSCGERNAFRTMYTVSAHDNFPTLLHCRNCDQIWSS